MTTTIVSQFQGTITIPLFKTPYTVHANDPAGTNEAFCTQSEGQIMYGQQGEAQMDSCSAATINQLSIANTTQIKIGGGSTGGPPSALVGQTTSWFYNIVFAFSNGYLNTSVAPKGMSFVTIPSGAPVSTGPINFGSSCYDLISGLSDALAISGPYGALGFAVNSNGHIPILTGTYQNDFASNTFVLFWGVPSSRNVYSGFSLMPSFFNASTGQQKYASNRIIPDYVNKQSVLFARSLVSAVYGIWGCYFDVNLSLATAQFSGEFYLTTDNATINDAITNPLSAQSSEFYGTARGWLLNTSNGDYFFSPDGTRYWQLVYAPQPGVGVVVPVGPDSKDSPYNYRAVTKNIDFTGVFWYTGQATTNFGTQITQPLYSFGFSLPYAPIYLPGVPPISIPCWNPCCDCADPGITAIDDKEY